MLTPDTPYQKLHALCQQAGKLMEDDNEASSGAFHSLLNELAIFAREHFAAEEELLRQTNPALLDSRLAEHLKYESQLMDILIAASDGILDKKRLYRFLTEWWSMYAHPSDTPLRAAMK